MKVIDTATERTANDDMHLQSRALRLIGIEYRLND